MNRSKYVIIGNSAGAIGAIEGIRLIDKEGRIVVISDEKYAAYSRPRISDCIVQKTDDAETIAYRPADFYEKFDVKTILGTKATAIDLKERTVTLESGEVVGYEKLLLTTGANPSKPPIPGIDLPNVHSFTTWDHAEKVAHQVGSIEEVVIIGGGLIGMQAAEALSKVGVKVTVVEMLDRVLALAIDKHGSEMIEAKFRENGVTLLTSCGVSRIEGDPEKGVTHVVLSDGRELPCQSVIVAAGVRPRTELAVQAGIAVRRGIPVDDFMQTSAPDVYAAGDVAETLDLLSGEQKLTPIWPNAYMEGRIAGAAMAGRPVPYSGGIPMNTAHFFGFPVMSAGITEMGEGCTELVQSNEKTGFYRRIILKNNVPIGMVMAGDAVDRGGIILGLIRKRTDASSFLKELADPDFNIAKMPVDMRKTKQLGKEQI
jgi:NAD(P)H-nitrite reductase large subunit